MKARKSGIIAAFAVVLLASAALITSCMDNMDLSSLPGMSNRDQTTTEIIVPPGKAVITINVNEIARTTVFPTLPDIANLYFDAELEVVGGDGNADIEEEDYTLGTAIPVVPTSTYNITLFAFTDAARQNLVGNGTANNISPAAGEDTNVPIELTPIGVTDPNNQGTFAWNLTLPANAESANMTFTGLTDGTSPQVDIDISTNNNNAVGILLNSGYYRVTVEFDADNHESVSIPVIVHIYGSMTSTYTRAFVPLNRNAFQVQFFNNNDQVVDTAVTGQDQIVTLNNIAHGDTINRPTQDPIHTIVPSRTFDNWYTTLETGGQEWVFENDPPATATQVFRDRILYARYFTVTYLNITATWVANAIDNTVITLASDSFTAYWDALEGGDNVVVTITISNASAFDTIELFHTSDPHDPVPAIFNADNGTIIFDLQDHNEFWFPSSLFTLEATIIEGHPDGVQDVVYSGSFTIEIE